jgi:hypothetical protein
MKKYMIADLVKDSREDLVLEAMEEYNLDRANAEIFVDNFPNQSTWPDVEATAEALGVDITDVEDDDVENYMSMGGEAKGELESSVGLIQWLYDNKLKAYLILMILNDRPIMYKVSPEMMKDWKDSQSMGEYYNSYIRGNITIEDPNHSCGCGPNPCEQGQVDQYKAKYSSIS